MAWGERRPLALPATPELGLQAKRKIWLPKFRAGSATAAYRSGGPLRPHQGGDLATRLRGAVGALELAGVCQTLLLRLSGAALGPLAAPAVALVAVQRQLFSRPLCGPLSPLAPHEGRDLLWRALRAYRVLPPSGPLRGHGKGGSWLP